MATRIQIRVRYGRFLDLIVLVVVLAAAIPAAYLGGDAARAAAPGVSASPAAYSSLRQYYLTRTTYDGAGAPDACTAGYHMASLWEILEPSGLKYNTELGYLSGDGGQGPSTSPGWVRTGMPPDGGVFPGQGNCYGWTDSASGINGTMAQLSWGDQDYHVWHAFTLPCDNPSLVWCVEDFTSYAVYLPCVLR
jgi:hypothetical protein